MNDLPTDRNSVQSLSTIYYIPLQVQSGWLASYREGMLEDTEKEIAVSYINPLMSSRVNKINVKTPGFNVD